MNKILYSFSSGLDSKNIATCECYNDKIILRTVGGGFWVRYYSDKTRTIWIRDIASVIISEGADSFWTTKDGRVYIQFHVKGSPEKSIDELMHTNDSANGLGRTAEFIDNGIVLIVHKDRDHVLPIMRKIREYVENYSNTIAQAEYIQHQNAIANYGKKDESDPYSEIVRYKQLLDDGIITQEEFVAAKRLILHMD